MRLLSSLFIALLFAVPAAWADIEKIAIPSEKEMLFYWWPKLPNVAGWHQDREHSFLYGVNAIAPDNATFANAETVMYAKASFKPRDPEIKSIEMLIARDKKDFLKNVPGVEIREAKSLTTADGKQFKSFVFFPKDTGNWERVTYGEEGEYFLIFTVSSRSKAGYDSTESAYEKLIGLYSLGGDFDARVAEAKSATATTEGQRYDKKLGHSIGSAMQACVPSGSTAEANLGKFTLVGYVATSGIVSSVEVRPNTKVSECFASKFRQLELPTPPASLALKSGVPIIVEMSVAP